MKARTEAQRASTGNAQPAPRGSKGTREIRVILYAKDDPFCVTALADDLLIEILAVEHDIVPFYGADVFHRGEIDSVGEQVALTQDPGDSHACQ